MTFRARLVLAATTAVVIAVVLASVAAYLVAYNSLIGSVDDTLYADASSAVTSHQIYDSCSKPAPGVCIQVVGANGSTGLAQPILSIIPQVRAVADASDKGTVAYATTTVRGTTTREIAYPITPGYEYQTNGPSGPELIALPSGGALQVSAPLTGVDQQLGRLALDLWIIAAGGIAVAVMLGLGVGRTALVPLNDLTRSIEELAETTDVSEPLAPGGNDELGRLRRAFNRLLAALDSSRDAQRQLVLDASHELRTPLTSLRTNMEVARRMDELPPGDRDVLINDVLTQLDELSALVGDLAELSRGELPREARRPVRLDAIVHDAAALATTHGRVRGVTFVVDSEPTWVDAPRGRIERAVGNLLDNALKWSPDHGVVEVACREGTVTVRDHGPGVDDIDLSRIFDRFYRAPAARGKPGSGLGLAIVAQVATEEHGTVGVANAGDGGAVFTFRLPVVPAPPEGEPED
ncbi:MAG: HAMP domain-containing sensor histidine kinase [Actinomycetota bacterium]|nr:HAMP domain-containing sensor histidine kinase [Actinomycetota bacterium]